MSKYFQKDYPFRPLNSKALGTPIQFDAITDTIGVIKLEDSDPVVAELELCVKEERHGVRALTEEQYASWQKKRQPLSRGQGRQPQREQLSAGIAQDTSRTLLKGKSDAVVAAIEAPAPETAPAPASNATRGPRRTVAPAPPAPRVSAPVIEPLTEAEIFGTAPSIAPATA